MNDNVALTLWGKNLTDEVKRVSANPVGTLWNFARYAPPRSIGVRAAFNF
jgi:iron complex outermembrane receptor protein